MQVIRTPEFENWLSNESAKVQALVESRVFRIEHYDHLVMQSISETDCLSFVGRMDLESILPELVSE